MKLKNYRILRYALPLQRPLTTGRDSVMQREGLILELIADTGTRGWGEIAPLPGLSTETLDVATAQLHGLVPGLIRRDLDAEWVWTRGYDAGRELASSVRFGFEGAYLDVLAKDAGVGLHAVIGDESQAILPVNALLAGNPVQVLADADARLAEGYRCLKLKVGREEMAQDVETVKAVLDRLPKACTLRLDANRAWNLADAVWFAKQVASEKVAYIEEPLKDPEDLHEFAGESPVRAALDETLVELGANALDRFEDVAAAIIKPGCAGGFSASVRLAAAAWEKDIQPVISGMFESGVGTNALVQLAAALHGPGVAAGLDTYRWLQKDLVDPGLEIIGGQIDVERLSRTLFILQDEYLSEVANG